MKNKGISYFEQHVEKFVLGAVGVVFVSVLVWQLFPTTVKVEGKDVALGDIDREIAAKTEMLKRKLETQGTPLSEQLKGKMPPRFDGDAFAAKASERSLQVVDLPQSEPRIASGIQPPDILKPRIYHEPRFAAAEMGETIQIDDTIEQAFMEANPKTRDFAAVAAGSLDVSWLVPNAVIDAKAMFAELGAGDEEQRIPPRWYKETLFLVDVEFERQEVLPDGSAGATSIVEPLPAAFTLRNEILQNPDAGLRDSVWESLSDPANQRAVLQPEFVPTRSRNFSSGIMLNDPAEMNAVEDPVVRSLKKRVASLTLDVDRLEADLKAIGGPLEDTSKEDKKREEEEREESEGGSRGGSGNSGQNRPGGGLGGGGLSGGMEGGKRGAGGADPQDDKTKQRRIKMTKALKEKRADLESAEKALKDKGGTAQVSKATGVMDVKSEGRLVIWAHDLGVSPGKRYRYRAVAKSYNPFFTYGGLLESAQRDLAKPFTLSTARSEWSDPIMVQPRVAFFITDAVPAEGRLGVGQASLEIYSYKDGERKLERVTLQPGDAIGSAMAGADGTARYFVVDVVADPTVERGGSDRRPSAIVLIQSIDGGRYEVRVPSREMKNERRLGLEDEVELAKLNKAKEDGKSADADQDPATPAAPPRGPTGR